MAKVKPREVLGVQRDGFEDDSFHLLLNGVPNVDVQDDKCTWEIDGDAKKTVAYVQREVDPYYIGDEPELRLRVKKVKIVGSRDKIENLLYNLGKGLPGQRVDPRWGEKEEDPL